MAWVKGKSGNPNGRPKTNVIEKFRENPNCESVINKVMKTAMTLNMQWPVVR